MGLFEKPYREAWEQLCKETNARYIRRKGVFGSWLFSGDTCNDSVELTHKNWKIILNISRGGKSRPAETRMRTEFTNKTGIVFTINQGFNCRLFKYGSKKIATGNAVLDSNFRIRSNNEIEMQRLFSNQSVSNLIDSLGKGMALGIQGKNRKSLILVFVGAIKDVDKLKRMFALFVELLDAMEHLDIISGNVSSVTV